MSQEGVATLAVNHAPAGQGLQPLDAAGCALRGSPPPGGDDLKLIK
jgi:hypothetical protein